MYTKIHRNGIIPEHTRYEIEKIVAFNWQIFICIIVSVLFVFLSLIYQFFLLSIFATSYLLLFSLSFYFIHKYKHQVARNIYLFTSNYSVFSISFCFGYEAGFYFYFFTTPLTVFISYDNVKRIYNYLALSTYLINAFVLNYLYHKGTLVNPEILNETGIIILFNLNLWVAFMMIFMFMNSIRRINRLKTMEAEHLHQKQSVLEAQIHQKQLDETKVQYQYQKLESEYQQLDMFSHIISHNLRGPISRVRGILELLKPFPSISPDQKVLMEHLHSSVLMIDEVIKDLNYLLVQKKLGQESQTYIGCEDVMQEVKLLLSEEIKASGAQIHLDMFKEKIPCIKGMMISIFYNLISNGIKYAMPGQRPAIYIRAEKKQDLMMLTFRDEGLGFDSEKYGDKVFRLYNRFHSHVSGKGMGLFLVKSHIEMLDGTIKVESIPRKGTTFTISLPLKENLLPLNISSDKSWEEEMLK